MYIKEMKRRKNQHGDTIIEVLITVSIVIATLTSAYMLSSRGAQTMQNASEQTQALKLAERQIELLRTHSALPGPGGCYDATGAVASTPGDCIVDSSGTPKDISYTGARYTIGVTKPSDVYIITVTWDRIGGGKGNVTLYYVR